MIRKQLITPEEYKQETDKLKKWALENELTEIKDGELLLVVSHYRNDDDLIKYGETQQVFKKSKDMFDYISLNGEVMETQILDEEENSIWFEVTKYITYFGEYRASVRCDFNAYCDMIAVQFYVPDIAKNGSASYGYDKRNQLLMHPNISYPFEIGDILTVNAVPYSEPFQIIYCGATEGANILRIYDCIHYRDVGKGLEAGLIQSNFVHRLARFPNAPVNMLSKAKDCDDELLIKVSKKLKEQPELWSDCVKRYKWDIDKGIDELILEG